MTAIAGGIKEATPHLPDEAMEAMSTPMHLFLPASPSSGVGALYLGSLSPCFDPELLTSHSISIGALLLEAAWLAGVEGIENIERYQVDIPGSVKVDLKPNLEAAVRWIDERLKKGVNLLVHCQEVRAC